MSALAKQNAAAALARPHETGYFSREQIDTLKNVLCPGLTDSELNLVAEVAKQTGLSPFAKQLYVQKRWDSMSNSNRLIITTGIDGYRLTAERSGKYVGQRPYEWCGPDGVWHDIWLHRQPPAAARVTVLKAGCEPFVATARFDAYAQTVKGGGLNSMWSKMGAEQLAKCAEALALRKAFPQELSGVYTEEEMAQAENTREPVRAEVLEPPPRAPQLPASTPKAANTTERPLPTRTAKNYAVRECADKPFTELSDGDLGLYLKYYTEKRNSPVFAGLHAAHQAAVDATIAAAEAELERRIAEEASSAAADPGDESEPEAPADVPDEHEPQPPADLVEWVDDDGVIHHAPADSIEGQLALSVEKTRQGIDPRDTNAALGLVDPRVKPAAEKRTRRSAS